MDNGHLHDDKLFRAVNDRLSDYEAPYNGADWDAMSRSLDKLPKTSRFQWKFSLNSLIVGVAVAGLSVFAYMLAAGNGSAAPAPQAMEDVTKPQPAAKPVKTSLPVTMPVTMPVTSNNEPPQTAVAANMPENGNGSSMDATMRPEKKQRKNKLLFGDQIDPRKGFIYQTQENSNIAGKEVDVSKVPYYDIKNGETKQFAPDTTGKGSFQHKELPKQPETTPGNGGGFGTPANGEEPHSFGNPDGQ